MLRRQGVQRTLTLGAVHTCENGLRNCEAIEPVVPACGLPAQAGSRDCPWQPGRRWIVIPRPAPHPPCHPEGRAVCGPKDLHLPFAPATRTNAGPSHPDKNHRGAQDDRRALRCHPESPRLVQAEGAACAGVGTKCRWFSGDPGCAGRRMQALQRGAVCLPSEGRATVLRALDGLASAMHRVGDPASARAGWDTRVGGPPREYCPLRAVHAPASTLVSRTGTGCVC